MAIRELARVGKFGQDGTEVTARDLQEVAETFCDEAPIALGHSTADYMPAFGWVKKPVVFDASANPQRLTGDVQPNALLSDAEDQGLYKKWSVGIRTNAATGKKYLHHLAFLGSVPPKIQGLLKDLQIVNMADSGAAPQALWTFGDDDPKPSKENTMPEKTSEQLAAEAAAASQTAAGAAGTGTQSAEMKNLSDTVAGQQGTIDTLTAQLRQGKIDTLKKALAGRIPAAKHADVIALADSLPLETSIELADDKGVKSKKSPIDLLIDIVGAIALPVQPGRMNLGDPPDGDGKEVKIDMKKMMAVV